MVHDKEEMVFAKLTTYGCSGSISKDDKRQPHWREQREDRGFDDTEMFCLTTTIAQFVLPRLKTFKSEYALCSPESKTYQAIGKMIAAFELVAADGIDYRFANTKDGKIYVEGIKAFHDYYLALWC